MEPSESPLAGPDGKVRRADRYPAAVQCTSTRRDGGRCGRWSVRGGHTCVKHSTPASRAKAAQTIADERAALVGLLPRARQVLAENMDNSDPDVRHRAAVQVQRLTPVWSPGGSTHHISVDATIKLSPAEIIRTRLAEVRAARLTREAFLADPTLALESGPVEIVDAELLDDSEWTPPDAA